jgi:hypothetical protein
MLPLVTDPSVANLYIIAYIPLTELIQAIDAQRDISWARKVLGPCRQGSAVVEPGSAWGGTHWGHLYVASDVDSGSFGPGFPFCS